MYNACFGHFRILLMRLNIIIYQDIALALCAQPGAQNIKQDFARLRANKNIQLYLSVATLAVLEHLAEDQQALKHLEQDCELLSSLAAHRQAPPSDIVNVRAWQISQDAASLPGISAIWTHQEDFPRSHVLAGNALFLQDYLHRQSREILLQDLESQQLCIRNALEKRLWRILKQGRFVHGEEVRMLEEKLAHYTGSEYCVAVANGTDALTLALLALGIGPGDEVITTTFSFIATAEAIALLGANPVFVDIDPLTYNLDPALLEASITPRTKAIIPVNLYGQCADFDVIQEIADQYNLFIIEDAAQSFGARYKDRMSGNLGEIACTSFYPTKLLGCYGDGGACFTNRLELAQRLRYLRDHGQVARYQHHYLGMNSRLDTIQAGVLLEKLENVAWEAAQREHLGRRYNALLKGIPGLVTPYIAPYNHSVYAHYTVRTRHREAMRTALWKAGIPSAVPYPLPLHQQEAFARFGCEEARLPVAEQAAQEVLSLPLHPYLEEQDLVAVATVLKESVS